VARRSSNRPVSSSSSSTVGIESLETRALMSASLPNIGGVNFAAPKADAVMIAMLLPAKAGPTSLPVPGDVVATGPGGGPHANPLIIPGPHFHPGGVNVDQSLAATITFGGTMKDASGTFSLTFNGQT
jgi:hypothetical protein